MQLLLPCTSPLNSASVPVFLKFVESLFEHASSVGLGIFLVGDFNIIMLRLDTLTCECLDMVPSNGRENVVWRATRAVTENEFLVDLCITNLVFSDSCGGVLSYDLSGHFPVFLPSVGTRKIKDTASLRIMLRDTGDGNISEFYSLVESENWDPVLKKTKQF